MLRSSGTSEPSPGEPKLDERVCAELGVLLGRARAERELSIATVADRLLLSTRQVRALEHVEAGAFYNPAFFVTALKKYALLLGVASDLLERALVADPPPPPPSAPVPPQPAAAPPPPAVTLPAPVVAEPAARPDVPASERAWPAPALAGSTVVVCALLGLGVYALWPGARTTPDTVATNAAAQAPPRDPVEPPVATPLPQTPSPEPVTALVVEPSQPPAPPPSVTRPAPLPVDPSGAYGRVRVGRTTWVYLRYANGAVVERMLLDGEEVVIESQPAYLAVGIPDVELTLGDRRVDVSRFVANGQVRIRSADFASLASGGAR